jgi:hypothetical protein
MRASLTAAARECLQRRRLRTCRRCTFPSTSPQPSASPSDVDAQLEQLSDLRTKNPITDEEYQAKRRAILGQMQFRRYWRRAWYPQEW